jgi:hypothetical protein
LESGNEIMLPSESKVLKKFADALRTELSSALRAVHEAIGEQTNAATHEQTANREEQKHAIGALRSISDGIQSGNEEAQNSSEQAHGQQERLITAQNWLVLWAALAFFAASFYGAVAFWQGVLMRRTYKEIQKQTYTSCLNALAAQETFIQVQRSAIDSHTAAAAAVQQATAQIESQRAVLLVSFRAPENGQFLPGVPVVKGSIDQLGVPWVLRNDGKTTANFVLSFTGVLLGGTDKFVIKDTSHNSVKGTLDEGSQIPEKKEKPGDRQDVPHAKPGDRQDCTP